MNAKIYPYVGDVSALDQMADYIWTETKRDGNWLIGTFTRGNETINAQIKVFADPSEFGIGGGRVSKLWLAHKLSYDRKGYPGRRYERGWDNRAADAGTLKLVDAIIEALDGKPVDWTAQEVA